MSNGELWTLTAMRAAAEIADGTISAEELSRACLDRVAITDKDVKAFAHLDPAHVLSQARALDERRRSGLPIGLLHGVPIAIKDTFDTGDYATECGSQLLAGRRPRDDANVVSRLRTAGAVIVGKTITNELAYGHTGPTRNPRDLRRAPGGSSSGSAAAVAAGMVPLALGSETNGSIIRPAAFCGVFGVKPSHGLVSRAGVLTLSRALDHVGAFARTLQDLALLLEVITGYDAADPDTRAVAAPAFRQVLSEPPPLPPRLAFLRLPGWKTAAAETQAALAGLERRLGENAEWLDLPKGFASAGDAHRAIMVADMAHNLGPMLERGGAAVSPALQALLQEGRKVTAASYLAALQDAHRFKVGLADVFTHFDAILTPAAPGVAPKRETDTDEACFCSLWDLTGLPTMSLPLLDGEKGLPLGVQIAGAAGDDARLLRTANWLLKKLASKAPSRTRTRAKN